MSKVTQARKSRISGAAAVARHAGRPVEVYQRICSSSAATSYLLIDLSSGAVLGDYNGTPDLLKAISGHVTGADADYSLPNEQDAGEPGYEPEAGPEGALAQVAAILRRYDEDETAGPDATLSEISAALALA